MITKHVLYKISFIKYVSLIAKSLIKEPNDVNSQDSLKVFHITICSDSVGTHVHTHTHTHTHIYIYIYINKDLMNIFAINGCVRTQLFS